MFTFSRLRLFLALSTFSAPKLFLTDDRLTVYEQFEGKTVVNVF